MIKKTYIVCLKHTFGRVKRDDLITEVDRLQLVSPPPVLALFFAGFVRIAYAVLHRFSRSLCTFFRRY